MEFKAEWTGSYPSLCIGEWKLYRRHNEYLDDGTIDIWYDDISNLIPEDLKHEPIEDYTDGMNFKEWCKENESWIHLICDPKDYKSLYEAFNEHDWRYESCGGCI